MILYIKSCEKHNLVSRLPWRIVKFFNIYILNEITQNKISKPALSPPASKKILLHWLNFAFLKAWEYQNFLFIHIFILVLSSVAKSFLIMFLIFMTWCWGLPQGILVQVIFKASLIVFLASNYHLIIFLP